MTSQEMNDSVKNEVSTLMTLNKKNEALIESKDKQIELSEICTKKEEEKFEILERFAVQTEKHADDVAKLKVLEATTEYKCQVIKMEAEKNANEIKENAKQEMQNEKLKHDQQQDQEKKKHEQHLKEEKAKHDQQLDQERKKHEQHLKEEKAKHHQGLKRKEREHDNDLKQEKQKHYNDLKQEKQKNQAEMKKLEKDMMESIYDTIRNPSLDTFKYVQVRKPELEILAKKYNVPITNVPEMRRAIAIMMKLETLQNKTLQSVNSEECIDDLQLDQIEDID